MIMTVEMAHSLRGHTINLFILLQRDSRVIPGSEHTNGTIIDRTSVYLRASWTARVGKMYWRLLQSSKSLEQKKEAPSCPPANTLSAIVCAIVLFPVPASPFNQ